MRVYHGCDIKYSVQTVWNNEHYYINNDENEPYVVFKLSDRCLNSLWDHNLVEGKVYSYGIVNHVKYNSICNEYCWSISKMFYLTSTVRQYNLEKINNAVERFD